MICTLFLAGMCIYILFFVIYIFTIWKIDIEYGSTGIILNMECKCSASTCLFCFHFVCEINYLQTVEMASKDTYLQEDSHIFDLFLDWREYRGSLFLRHKTFQVVIICFITLCCDFHLLFRMLRSQCFYSVNRIQR